jgi:hypothetical protein
LKALLIFIRVKDPRAHGLNLNAARGILVMYQQGDKSAVGKTTNPFSPFGYYDRVIGEEDFLEILRPRKRMLNALALDGDCGYLGLVF